MPESTFFSTLTATGTKDCVALETITAKTDCEYRTNFINNILKPQKYRPISASEAARLQGFPSSYKFNCPENTNKKLLGNSVSVPVIEQLGHSIIKTGVFGN